MFKILIMRQWYGLSDLEIERYRRSIFLWSFWVTDHIPNSEQFGYPENMCNKEDKQKSSGMGFKSRLIPRSKVKRGDLECYVNWSRPWTIQETAQLGWRDSL